MEGKYLDSIVVIYHGPRRGGKTVSMSYDISCDMLSGRRCFSNYPIAFDYTDEDGQVTRYESEPLDTDELLYIDRPEIKKKYDGAVIGWDESALSLFSRNFMSARNKMMGLVITLIGKLEMNFYFTCQFLTLLDKNIKLQMDTLVFCNDLSFKYKHFERGAKIGQSFQDISGRSTGEMFEYSNRVFRQTFNARPFWDIYNTKETFPILQRKLKDKDIRAGVAGTLPDGEIYEADEDQSRVIGGAIIEHLITEMLAVGNAKIQQSILYQLAKGRGYTGKVSEMGGELLNQGAKNFISNAGSMWDLESAGVLVNV